MRRLTLLILVIWTLQAISFQSSQNIRHITTDDGLSQNLIFDDIQDQKGYIWLGTKDGLNRYDGYEFRIFRNNPPDTTSLSSNHVTFVEEEQDGNLWVETRPGGLHRYDPDSERFLRINLLAGIPDAFRKATFRGVYGSSCFGWFAATDRGLFHLSADLSQVHSIPSPGGEPNISVHSLIPVSPDRNPVLVVGTNSNGIFRLEVKSQTTEPLEKLNRHLETSNLDRLYLDQHRRRWMLQQGNRLVITDVEGTLLSDVKLSDGQSGAPLSFEHLSVDTNGNLWGTARYKLY
ncbi:MAG: hypothetical protein R3281_05990 [Balneolaceae bacterium]|nr:hypothetical protein [Balneolaceae bacterium]